MEGDRFGGCYSPLLTEGFGGGVEGYGVQQDTLTHLLQKKKGKTRLILSCQRAQPLLSLIQVVLTVFLTVFWGNDFLSFSSR